MALICPAGGLRPPNPQFLRGFTPWGNFFGEILGPPPQTPHFWGASPPGVELFLGLWPPHPDPPYGIYVIELQRMRITHTHASECILGKTGCWGWAGWKRGTRYAVRIPRPLMEYPEIWRPSKDWGCTFRPTNVFQLRALSDERFFLIWRRR